MGDYDNYDTMMENYYKTVDSIIGDKFDFIYGEEVNGRVTMQFENEIIKNIHNNIDTVVKLEFYNSPETIYILIFPMILFVSH